MSPFPVAVAAAAEVVGAGRRRAGGVGTIAAMPDPVPLEYSSGRGSAVATWSKRLAVALVFWPLLLLASVYVAWLFAWAQLGHRPEPGWDDPGSAGWLVSTAIVTATVLMSAAWVMFILHLALVGAAFYPLLTPDNPHWRRIAVLAAAVLPWAAAFVLLNADPGNVMKWAGLTPP